MLLKSEKLTTQYCAVVSNWSNSLQYDCSTSQYRLKIYNLCNKFQRTVNIMSNKIHDLMMTSNDTSRD